MEPDGPDIELYGKAQDLRRPARWRPESRSAVEPLSLPATRSWIKRNAPQSKVETPPQGWRRAGNAIADGDKLDKLIAPWFIKL